VHTPLPPLRRKKEGILILACVKQKQLGILEGLLKLFILITYYPPLEKKKLRGGASRPVITE